MENGIKCKYKVIYQEPKVYINPDVLDDLQDTLTKELEKDPLYIRYLRKEKINEINAKYK